MRKIKSGTIKLSEIKYLENSRLRENDDVSVLMTDIEQRGLLEPVGIRLKDNALVFGNRRVNAFKKLGYTEIDAVFYDDMSDEELFLANISENIKRKSIGNFEVGRMCDLLTKKNMTKLEIAETLNMTIRKISSLILAYKVTEGTPFWKLITSGDRRKHLEGIPESLIWKIHNSIPRALGHPLTKNEWNILLEALNNNEITSEHITKLRQVLFANKGMTIENALILLKKCSILHVFFSVDSERLATLMEEEKATNTIEFIKNIIRKYDKRLIF